MAKHYAHARIHDHEADVVYERGDEVGPEIPGFDELVEGESIKTEPYVPEEPETDKPSGDVTHVSSSDEGSGNDDSA